MIRFDRAGPLGSGVARRLMHDSKLREGKMSRFEPVSNLGGITEKRLPFDIASVLYSIQRLDCGRILAPLNRDQICFVSNKA